MLVAVSFAARQACAIDLELSFPPQLKFNSGILVYDPVITGDVELSTRHYFALELMVENAEPKEWVKFGRESKILLDAIINLGKLKPNDVIKQENLFAVSRNGNDLTFTIYRKRNEEYSPFSFVCKFEDAIVFSKRVKEIDDWFIKQFKSKRDTNPISR